MERHAEHFLIFTSCVVLFAGYESKVMVPTGGHRPSAILSRLVTGKAVSPIGPEVPVTVSQKDNDGKKLLLNQSTIESGKLGFVNCQYYQIPLFYSVCSYNKFRPYLFGSHCQLCRFFTGQEATVVSTSGDTEIGHLLPRSVTGASFEEDDGRNLLSDKKFNLTG